MENILLSPSNHLCSTATVAVDVPSLVPPLPTVTARAADDAAVAVDVAAQDQCSHIYQVPTAKNETPSEDLKPANCAGESQLISDAPSDLPKLVIPIVNAQNSAKLGVCNSTSDPSGNSSSSINAQSQNPFVDYPSKPEINRVYNNSLLQSTTTFPVVLPLQKPLELPSSAPVSGDSINCTLSQDTCQTTKLSLSSLVSTISTIPDPTDTSITMSASVDPTFQESSTQMTNDSMKSVKDVSSSAVAPVDSALGTVDRDEASSGNEAISGTVPAIMTTVSAALTRPADISIASPALNSSSLPSAALGVSMESPSTAFIGSLAGVSVESPLSVAGVPGNIRQPTLCYPRILLGEITALLAAMRRATPRWSQHQSEPSNDPLVSKLRDLQVYITSLSTRPSMPTPAPSIFLEPFLAVIRSDDTTGPVTKTALASVNRMLCYGLISTGSPNVKAAVSDIASAVTHARFVGTDQGADEVVLWEILTVLKTLLLSPVGHLLTNQSVCELLNSSFRICFETRLSELLRNCTEDALRQMVALLLARLPQLTDEPQSSNEKELKMKAGSRTETNRNGKKSKTSKLLQRSNSPVRSRPGSADDGGSCATGAADGTRNSSSDAKQKTQSQDAPKIPEAVQSPSENERENKNDSRSTTIGKDQSLQHQSNNDGSGNINNVYANTNNADAASIDSGITDPSLRDSSVDISYAHLTLENHGSLESLQSPVSDNESSVLPPSPAETPIDKNACSESSPAEASEAITTPTSETGKSNGSDAPELVKPEVFVNTQGVKFTPQEAGDGYVPYGMASVREVLRFLISLTSPANEQNTPPMIATALGLITVALEVGGEHINKCPIILFLIKDQLCNNLLMLLKPEVRPTILMASLRVCILVFEGLRTHVKFQLEMFMNKLTDIITSEASNQSYAHKELALESVVQLWRIPGLITELFVNFDCDLYSDNIFEDLTKILSKNAFPVQGLYSTNLLSLDALLTVIDTLDSHSLSQVRSRAGPKSSKGRVKTPTTEALPAVVTSPVSGYLLGIGLLNGFSPVTPVLQPFTLMRDDSHLLREHLMALKEQKRLLATGTDQFNVKPEKGIQFLQDNGILGTTYQDIAILVKENPKLDKKMIGEYLSKKKNVGILSAFVRSFEFSGLRIDECLRMFLEAFRLPGEAPVISVIIEYFSSHWHTSNNEPFGKDDAAFTLAYAVIILNVDQHNLNAKKQNVPMTVDQFRNNLRGVNDGDDFDPNMLKDVYNAIANEEIIMPAEQKGLVKENYMWKMLLKRGATKEGKYMLANDDHSFDRDIFAICWGPTVASLSYVFDKSTDDAFIQKSLSGFKKCASIAARYGMSDVFDNLVVSLCKFTGLTSSVNSADTIAIEFGSNAKAQLAAKTLFRLVTVHGDILRDGWKNVVEVLLQLFRSRLLPDDLTQSPDIIEGVVSLYRPNNTSQPRVEPSLLSSLYLYIAMGDGGARGTTPEDEECRERAKKCIVECHIEKLIRESAFLRHDALSDMLKAIMTIGDGSCLVSGGRGHGGAAAADGSHTDGESLDEYGHALLLEIVVQIIIANKDRAVVVWSRVHDYIFSLMMTSATRNKPGMDGHSDGHASKHAASDGHQQAGGSSSGAVTAPKLSTESVWLLRRCVAALMRMAGVLGRRPDMSSLVLQSLKMLFLLNPYVMAGVSLQVVAGVHEVLTLTADHITHSSDWAVVFALLECAGAGAKPPSSMRLHAPNLHQQNLHMRSLPESELGSSSGPDSGHCSEVGSGNEGARSSTAAGAATAASDSSSTEQHAPAADAAGSRAASPEASGNRGGWIMVGKGPNDVTATPSSSATGSSATNNQWDIVQQREFSPGHPSPDAVVRGVDTLAFLVRERHITCTSLPYAVQAARTFVEATLHGGRAELQLQQRREREGLGASGGGAKSPQRRRLGGRRRGGDDHHHIRGGSSSGGGGGGKKSGRRGGSAATGYDADESDSDDVPVTFQQLSEKLLDLLDTLHTTAGSVMVARTSDTSTSSSATNTTDSTQQQQSDATGGGVVECNGGAAASVGGGGGSGAVAADTGVTTTPLDFTSGSLLWQEVLCPLLQGIARYCCDNRSRIRHLALTYLQRALLNHDLQTLDAYQWEACFNKVLFPLLSALLPVVGAGVSTAVAAATAAAMEESRLRAATLVQKVYLRHLSTLLTLPTFTALWLTILDYLDKYLNINTTDHLCDAVPEILKNMLLVMETTQVFHTAHGFTKLWSVTWDRVDSFLPGFRTELFKSHPPSKILKIEASPDQPVDESILQQNDSSSHLTQQQPPQAVTLTHPLPYNNKLISSTDTCTATIPPYILPPTDSGQPYAPSPAGSSPPYIPPSTGSSPPFIAPSTGSSSPCMLPPMGSSPPYVTDPMLAVPPYGGGASFPVCHPATTAAAPPPSSVVLTDSDVSCYAPPPPVASKVAPNTDAAALVTVSSSSSYHPSSAQPEALANTASSSAYLPATQSPSGFVSYPTPPFAGSDLSVAQQPMDPGSQQYPVVGAAGGIGAPPSGGGSSMSDDESRVLRHGGGASSSDPAPSLAEQAAARLSLSEECLPSYASNIILQPPLPPRPFVTPLPNTHPVTPVLPYTLQRQSQEQEPAPTLAESSYGLPHSGEQHAAFIASSNVAMPDVRQLHLSYLQQQQQMNVTTEAVQQQPLQACLTTPSDTRTDTVDVAVIDPVITAAHHVPTAEASTAAATIKCLEVNNALSMVLRSPGSSCPPPTASRLFRPTCDADDPFSCVSSAMPHTGV